MISDICMRILFIVYFCISIICLLEHNYPKALYWCSAGFITFSVLWGMK